MNTTIILAIAFIIVGCLMYIAWIEAKRQAAFNNINRYYDEMELYVVKNRLTPDNEMINYLKAFKQFRVNNELADIQVLIMILATQKSQDILSKINERKRVLKKIPNELILIGNKIDAEVVRAIKLSAIKPDFIFIIAVILFKSIYKSIVGRSLSYLSDIKNGASILLQHIDVMPMLNRQMA